MMPKKKSSEEGTEQVRYPQFTSRQEEAAWYETHRDQLLGDLMRYGRMVPARIIEKTRQLIIRIPIADIERAREIGAQKGLPYQTILKQAIRDGLKRAG
jgi:predicted DNA binding CopG/RHH family protein